MKRKVKKQALSPHAKGIDKALRRARKRAHEIAKQYGTPIYVSHDGKVTALKP
ncbi:MAG TPA: hypothetical protein VJS89_01545 [Gammaproteobacteria bacterium]|nr:hypothetical protein [Gammaproteobacteria bacterium]